MKIARREFLGVLGLGAASTLLGTKISKASDKNSVQNDYTVACYYFPNYHVDPENEKLHGSGWTEWDILRNARPRFEGHNQPKVPLWGYTDEANPVQMAQKIDAAADHGIDAFIFDWYWYNNKPFLQRGLENGFLGAANNSRLKFSLMWANHDYPDVFPSRLANRTPTIYPGGVTRKMFDDAIDYIIAKYFKHSSYWLIDGSPYFSIYDIGRLIDGLGGKEQTQAALSDFRAKTKAEGFKDLHLNAVVLNKVNLLGDDKIVDMSGLIDYLGFSSFTSYVWIHHVNLKDFPQTDYNYVRDSYLEYWDEAEKKFDLPYFPNVTMGWDSTPRTLQSDKYIETGYPYIATLSGNTPQNFQKALEITKNRVSKQKHGMNILNINAWNEWTEGSYLEPDTINKNAYLEAVKNVFGS